MLAEGANRKGSTPAGCTDCATTARGSSFDELAKGLATGTISRGRALKMLGAALVGASLASIPGAAWAACKPLLHKCMANTECCSRNCIKNPRGNGNICGCPTGQTLCNNQCLTCTAPKVLNTSTCSCQCPANEACTSSGGTVNASTCECECPGGKVLCNGKCVTTCEAPQFLNADCQCECSTDVGCTSTGGNVNPTTCTCDCPTGKTVCGGQCVEVCAPPKVVLNTDTCQCECPPDEACTTTGGTVNPNTCQCECPGGKTLCQGQCVTSCDTTTGEVLNPDTCRCESPPSGCSNPGPMDVCCPPTFDGTTQVACPRYPGQAPLQACCFTHCCGPGQICCSGGLNGNIEHICCSASQICCIVNDRISCCG
jgi:hypothetical protein